MGIDPVIWSGASKGERRELLVQKRESREATAKTIQFAVLMVASVAPIYAISICLRAVAGKATSFSVTITASISLFGVAGLALKVALQRREIKRIRGRMARYELDVDRPPESRLRQREIGP